MAGKIQNWPFFGFEWEKYEEKNPRTTTWRICWENHRTKWCIFQHAMLKIEAKGWESDMWMHVDLKNLSHKFTNLRCRADLSGIVTPIQFLLFVTSPRELPRQMLRINCQHGTAWDGFSSGSMQSSNLQKHPVTGPGLHHVVGKFLVALWLPIC